MGSFSESRLVHCLVLLAIANSGHCWSLSSPFLSLLVQPQLSLETATANLTQNVTSSSSSSSSSSSTNGTSQSCIQNLLDRTVVHASIIIDLIRDVKDDYVSDNFHCAWDMIDSIFSPSDDQECLQVCDEDQVCSQVLPTVPTLPHSQPTNLLEKLIETTGYMRQYTVAMEQLVLDQSMAEDSFMEEFHSIYQEMSMLSRTMLQGLDNCEAVPEESTVRNLLSKMYVETRNSIQRKRGFTTLRQCLLGLQYIVDVFSSSGSNSSALRGVSHG